MLLVRHCRLQSSIMLLLLLLLLQLFSPLSATEEDLPVIGTFPSTVQKYKNALRGSSSRSTKTNSVYLNTTHIQSQQEDTPQHANVDQSHTTITTYVNNQTTNERQQQEQHSESTTTKVGAIEIVSTVDQEELEKCLQRRDLEEVFGIDVGVICSCISAVIVSSSSNQENYTNSNAPFPSTSSTTAVRTERQMDNILSNTSSSSSLITTVNIVVQLSCTDSRSRINTGGVAGTFSYCLPKDEQCVFPDDDDDEHHNNAFNNSNSNSSPTNRTTALLCCGHRICDWQRKQCVAIPSSTSARNGNPSTNTFKLGHNGSSRQQQRPAAAAAAQWEDDRESTMMVQRPRIDASSRLQQQRPKITSPLSSSSSAFP